MKSWAGVLIAGAVTLPVAAASTAASTEGARPSRYHVHAFDGDATRARLARAATERGVVLALPLPDGRVERFEVVESSIFGADFQRAHPDLRTYRASGIDDPSLVARLDLTRFGLRGIVFTATGAALIDPLERGRTDQVMSYWARHAEVTPFECGVDDRSEHIASPLGVHSAGDSVKTYRHILMATGEYTQFMGGVSQALAEMTTSMNRVIGIYERDAAIRLEVVQMVAFDNPATDPYPSSALFDLLERNTPVVDSLFGSAGYDLGQVLSRQPAGVNGVAYRPAVCGGEKAGSVASAADPTTLMFTKAMGHETGHQLGGTHTQDRNCSRSITPVEIGSGVTVLSSSGGSCPPDFVDFIELYLHVANIEQILGVTAVAPCGTSTPTGNSPPMADAGPDFTIPRGTPFVLTGSASDPDAGDALTYVWEQLDMAPTSADPVLGPLFRWRPPSTSPVRFMPQASTLFAGVPDPFEQLAAVDRLMRFRFTVRDNHAPTGGHDSDEMMVTVSGTPFAVTSPNGGDVLTGGSPFTVTWSVGGGSVAPMVHILLSTDGGATWTSLATSVPNDGAESVSHATASTIAACRIKVEAAGNIFYDVSDADFTITGSPVSVAEIDARPGEWAITVSPNPATGPLRVEYSVPRDRHVRLTVVDVHGREVATLVDRVQEVGQHHAIWSGTTSNGRRPGVYFVRIEGEGATAVRRTAIIQ